MIALLVRRARADAPLVLVTASVLIVTALAVAVPARLVAQMATAGLVEALERAGPADRALTMRRQTTTDTLTVAAARAEGERIRADLPPVMRSATSAPSTLVDSPRLEVVDPVLPGRPRRVTLRVQPGYRPHVRVVDGRTPRATPDRLPTPVDLQQDPGVPPQADMAVTEIAVSRSTADALQVAPGDVVTVRGDPYDPYARSAASPLSVLRIVGVVEPDDADGPLWFGDRSVHAPTEIPDRSGTSVTVYATALVAPAALDRLAATVAPLPLLPTWRMPVPPTGVVSATVDDLRSALRRSGQRYVTTPYVPPRTIGLSTSLGAVLDRYVAAQGATLRTISIVGAGCAGVLLAVIALLVALRARLRHRTHALLRARGASAAQVVALDLAELVPAGLVAVTAAALVALGGPSPLVVLGAALLSVGAVAVALAVAGGGARRRATAGPGVGRLVVEIALVVLAVAGAVAARRRGLVTSDGDPLLVAVPAVAAAAAGLLLVRLLPPVARGLLTVVGDERSVAVVTGLRRVMRRPEPSTLPVLAVTVATAIVVLTATAALAVDRTLDRAAWLEVGAPAVVDGGDPVPGASPAFLRRRVAIAGRDTTVLAVDPATYAPLVAGSPAATDLAPLRGGGAPLPAITSPTVATVGGVVDVSLPGVAVVPIEVRATAARFPGLSQGTPFVVVPLTGLAEAVPTGVAPNRWYTGSDRAPAGARTRATAERALAAAALPAAGMAALRAGAALAAALGVAAACIGLVLAARDRRRDIGHLQAVGMGRRGAVALTLVEALPPLAVAVLCGGTVGTGLVALFAAGLHLAPLAGGTPVAVGPDGAVAAVAAVALLVPITLGTLVVAWRGSEQDLAAALRTEEP